MSKVAIFREGDPDSVKLEDGSTLNLRDVKGSFVKWNKNKCSVVFVGMFTYIDGDDKIAIFSLPKFFPKEKCTLDNLPEIKSQLKTICKVVEKLREKHKDFEFDVDDYQFDPYSLNASKEKVNRYELAEFIIEDYLQNGLYVKDLTETRKNIKGRTNWGKTVTKILPLIQDGIPVYLDLMNTHHIIDENDFMSVIHANVINQCLDFLGPLISAGIDYVDTEPLGKDLSAYSAAVNSYSSYVFREREINLFKAMEAWCKATRYYENYSGVTCFEKVWEWVNDAVWGNIAEPESGNPVYHLAGKDYQGTGEAIPDTIRIVKDEEKDIVYIFDSKYYTAKYFGMNKKEGFDTVIGFPANSDIVKQVAYLKLIKSQYTASELYNSFLMPEYYENCKEENLTALKIKNKEWFSVLGYVTPGSFDLDLKTISSEKKSDEEKVGVIFVDPDKLFDMFLNNKKASLEELQKTESYKILPKIT